MQAFIVAVLVKVLSDEKVQQSIEKLVSKVITENILPLVPVASAAAAKAVVELIPGGKAVADLAKVTEQVRVELNKVIPDIDSGIPLIDNILDAWRPKG